MQRTYKHALVVNLSSATAQQLEVQAVTQTTVKSTQHRTVLLVQPQLTSHVSLQCTSECATITA
jgi:hypothetical protein